ncbi:MAG: MarR family winged helix-turn-helix transcriptional regulator [Woeseiaceae bacterium]
MPASDRQRIEQASWFAVVEAYEKCGRLYAAMLDELSLTVAQYDALIVVRSLADEATPRAIAERLLVTRGNVTGLLRRLQDNGLLSTEKHPTDARSFLCHLTDEALRRLKLADKAASEFIRQQLAPFDSNALSHLERDMKRMSQHLDSMQPTKIAADAKQESS